MIFSMVKHEERKAVERIKDVLNGDGLLFKETRHLKTENASDPSELIAALDNADIETRILELNRQIAEADGRSFIGHHQLVLRETQLDKERSKELADYMASYFEDNTPIVTAAALAGNDTVIDLFLSNNARLKDDAYDADIDAEIVNATKSISGNRDLEVLYSSGSYSYFQGTGGKGFETYHYNHMMEEVKNSM